MLKEFLNQNLSMLAWSMATLDIDDRPLLAAIAAASLAKITEFDPAHFSIILWAFALLGISDKPLFTAIAA